MTAVVAPPFAPAGLRPLSAREKMRRLKALACSVPENRRPTCSGQIHVGLFFDGTGNNMELDYKQLPPERRKHSNVVRLFLACRDTPEDGYFAFYMPGVGTPFPEIGDSGRYRLYNRGSAHGEKGEHRILWALTRLINAAHRYVTKVPLMSDEQARVIINDLSAITSPAAKRRAVLKTWQDKLQAALATRRPEVEQINLSVFGFSRGAAQARAFVNWLFEACDQKDGGWTFAGIPLRCSFLGIFDTVASVGLANLDDTGSFSGHQSWADQGLRIHPAVERCVHFVAAHEVRACFPLDSVRVGTSYPANTLEVLYPGSHSDVGGGYAPGALGVSPHPNSFLSIIPGVRMYREACVAGVHLQPWDLLDKRIQEDFIPSDATVRDFNAYVQATAGQGTAPIEELHRRHMGLYYSWRFKHRHRFTTQAPYAHAGKSDQGPLARTQAAFIARLGHLGQGDPLQPTFNPARAADLHDGMHRAAGLLPSFKEKQLHEVARRIDVGKLTPAVERLFEAYVHDSMAGFLQMDVNEYALNGMGLSKFRSVFNGED